MAILSTILSRDPQFSDDNNVITDFPADNNDSASF